MQKRQKPRLQAGALIAVVVVIVFLWEFMEGGMNQNPWRLLPPFLAVVVLGAAAIILRSRRRTKTLRRVAAELGLDFHARGDDVSMRPLYDPIDAGEEAIALEQAISEIGGGSPEVTKAIAERFAKERSRRGLEQSVLRRLTLFQGVDHPAASNVMTGKLAGAEAVVFDYTYYTRQIDPSNSSSVTQTVAAYRFRGRVFPVFELSSRGLLQPASDVDFPSHPRFSKRYRLRGDDPNALRSLFDSGTLNFFESLDDDVDLTVEAAGECVVVHRHGHSVGEERLKAFVERATAIARTLGGATRSS